MASNLPPGCRVSDIPGNRPSDIKEEYLYELIYDILESCNTPPSTVDNAATAVFKLCGKVWQEAYAEGECDAFMAAELTKDKRTQYGRVCLPGGRRIEILSPYQEWTDWAAAKLDAK